MMNETSLEKAGSENSGALAAALSDFDLEEIREETRSVQYLLFQSSDGVYGINILETHEVLKPIPVTRLPNVEPEALGVINLRGSIIPVIDIKFKFGAGYTELTPLCRIVVCTYAGKMRGILVERVLEVARIPENSIEGAEVSDFSHRYISGVGRGDGRIFLILNPEAVFENTSEE